MLMRLGGLTRNNVAEIPFERGPSPPSFFGRKSRQVPLEDAMQLVSSLF